VIQTVFVHAPRALAAERTTIVLIESLHFAPEEGRALFAALAHAVEGFRILLVGTTRPGLPAEWVSDLDRQGHAQRLVLERLGREALANLLRDAFRSDRLADELGEKIARGSDGNPFFAFEIIRSPREGRTITRNADGTWAGTGVIERLTVPSSVLDLVRARISGLDEEERALLDVAVCCGFELDSLLPAAVQGSSSPRRPMGRKAAEGGRDYPRHRRRRRTRARTPRSPSPIHAEEGRGMIVFRFSTRYRVVVDPSGL
jgi:predicted ATPase